MIDTQKTHSLLTYCIGCIWIINGFFCKVLNMVPRHQEIVEAILKTGHGRALTITIGIAEIGMAIWIFSGRRPGLNAIVQAVIIAIMNALEFALVPQLLLWGKLNAVFAAVLILIIIYNQFFLIRKETNLS